MKRFAELLDRLAYEPAPQQQAAADDGLFPQHARSRPRLCAGRAHRRAVFQHAKPGIIRALIAERTDPVLFELSYDYVGDLSETVALMWPVDRAKRSAATATSR